jgi:hypothetical protein
VSVVNRQADSNNSEDSGSDQAIASSHKLTWEVLLLEAEREEQLTWDEQMAESDKEKLLRHSRLSCLEQEEGKEKGKETTTVAKANVEEKLDNTKLLTLSKWWSRFLYTSLPVTCVVC